MSVTHAFFISLHFSIHTAMIIDDIALTLHPRIGPRTAAHLLECFGSSEKVYAASLQELTEIAELNPELAKQVVAKACHRQAEQELLYCRKNGITPIASCSDQYPALLKECNDFPHVLYYKGDVSSLGNRRMLSIVGTRRMTSYGQKVCGRLIAGLAEICPDAVIVSGLAYGVDGECHRAALAYGLATVAVLPNPVTTIYPSQHTRLADEMTARGGGIISEYHSCMKMKGVTFLARNRIIAGIGAGTLIIESPAKGGSMITARLAHGYDRCVMAVPGRIGDTFSEGPNRLVSSETARLVCSAQDIVRELGWDSEITTTVREIDLSGLSKGAQEVFSLIAEGEAFSIDRIAELSGLPIAELSALLFELEFEGAIRALPGKLYERA